MFFLPFIMWVAIIKWKLKLITKVRNKWKLKSVQIVWKFWEYNNYWWFSGILPSGVQLVFSFYGAWVVMRIDREIHNSELDIQVFFLFLCISRRQSFYKFEILGLLYEYFSFSANHAETMTANLLFLLDLYRLSHNSTRNGITLRT